MPDFSEFPKVVSASVRFPRTYHLVTSYFAVHGGTSQAVCDPVMEFIAEKIAVYPIDRLGQMVQTGGRVSAVYSLQPDGLLAVPTGRIFVRLRSHAKFADHGPDFHDAGYEIVQTLPYALNAGWVRSSSSSIAASLAGLDKLCSISDVENIEPQMLRQAVRKD